MRPCYSYTHFPHDKPVFDYSNINVASLRPYQVFNSLCSLIPRTESLRHNPTSFTANCTQASALQSFYICYLPKYLPDILSISEHLLSGWYLQKKDRSAVRGAGNGSGSEGKLGGIIAGVTPIAKEEEPAMPGVLKALEEILSDSNRSEALAGSKSGSMSVEGLKKSKEETRGNGVFYTNGHSELERNHVQAPSADVTDSNAVAISGIGNLHVGQLPPEIEHITFGYLPLSRIITRLAQDTFNGLNDVISDMADLVVSQPSSNAPPGYLNPHVNGNGADDKLEANVRKKERLFDFAKDRRAQFIKILVLLDWSRQMDAISKVIDLKVWLDGQRKIYEDATLWMGELKRLLGPMRLSNPDLKTALATLSLGKAPWLPDLGYIPPKPLSPQELLRSLRHINTELSIRLNLHEKLPPWFRDFSIGSGRATFQVRDEFEVELSIADKDPQSQFYFIDFRFGFSPISAEVPTGFLRDEIERRTNDALKREGLSGCYDFLHDLVLTHKLNILKHQAYEMARGLWSQNLKVEGVHRSLVVQYWLNRPGGKNWIELGVKRGNSKNPLARHSQNSPHIALRWFRSGKEVPTVKANLHLGELSLQRILSQVIAMHTSFIFERTANRLKDGLIYSNRLLNLKNVPSVTEPLDATLLVQLTTSKAVKLIQEPVTGRFALLPSSPLYSQVEQRLNSLQDPASEASAQFAKLRAVVSVEEVEMRAQSYGWEVIKSLNLGQEAMRRLFPRETLRITLFRRTSWSQAWILAFTASLTKDTWWVVELGDRKAEVDSGIILGNSAVRAGPNFKNAFEVRMKELKSLITEPSYSTLAQVEHSAASMISQYIDTRELKARKTPHGLRPLPPGAPGSCSAILHLSLPSHPNARTPRRHVSNSPNCVSDTIALAFGNIDPVTHQAVHTVHARLRNPIPNIKDLTSNLDHLSFHPTSGSFSFRLLTSVGEVTIPSLLDRLASIERLIHFLSVVRLHNLPCKSISLNNLIFIYPVAMSRLKATIHFSSDEPMHISLEKGNPHLRIQDFLNEHLQSQNDGLGQTIKILGSTLPLLDAFTAIESAHTADNVHILPRSAIWYQIHYQSPKGRFDLKLRRKGDIPMWHIKDVLRPEERTEAVEQAMKSIKEGRGTGWWGMNGGIVAEFIGIRRLLREIDDIYRASAIPTPAVASVVVPASAPASAAALTTTPAPASAPAVAAPPLPLPLPPPLVQKKQQQPPPPKQHNRMLGGNATPIPPPPQLLPPQTAPVAPMGSRKRKAEDEPIRLD